MSWERRHAEKDVNTCFFPINFNMFFLFFVVFLLSKCCIIEFSKLTTWGHFTCILIMVMWEVRSFQRGARRWKNKSLESIWWILTTQNMKETRDILGQVHVSHPHAVLRHVLQDPPVLCESYLCALDCHLSRNTKWDHLYMAIQVPSVWWHVDLHLYIKYYCKWINLRVYKECFQCTWITQ